VSKLESLPNEILIHIFEEYINGVDIIVAFAYQQNQRFDGIIIQCQQYRFNFLHCQKDSFRFCIGLLPAYIERIEELVLSEQDTPGQLHAFLSFYPSFIDLKRLRKLHIRYNPDTIDRFAMETAIRSLFNTPIDTIIIQVINSCEMETLHYLIFDILKLKTIKRLVLILKYESYAWDLLTNFPSKIQYLTTFGVPCEFQQLQSIFRCAPHLKYLNVQLTPNNYYVMYYPFYALSHKIISMPTLHTLILSFQFDDETSFDMLAQSLKAMPALHRLDIQAPSALVDANSWETLLETSLPMLTHFTLKTTVRRLNNTDVEKVLASFQTPFWIAKENFYMIITRHQLLYNNKFGFYKIPTDDEEFNQPVIQCYIAPWRGYVDDVPTNDIAKFCIDRIDTYLLRRHYFRNVNLLVVYNLDEDLLEWLLICVNYSQIKHLDISQLDTNCNTTTSLLSYVRNIVSLRIKYGHLHTHQSAFSENNSCLKYLDMSLAEHRFHKKDIIIISKLFPHIEHLVINTKMLWNVPLLRTYLPRLCSLTFKIIDSQFYSYNTAEKKLWDTQLRRKIKFLFQRDDDWITVWIDQNALEESYWRTCNPLLDPGRLKSILARFFRRGFPFSK
jgi:hypothetical protein